MAKKKKTAYVCQSCGYDTSKWMGKCPGCGAWNSMVAEIVAPESEARRSGLGGTDAAPPQPIGEITAEDLPRFSTGSGELDRVLGGGVIPGSMVLVVGDPGVGKSSLTLRVSADIARAGRRVLYVTGEESARQIRMRADRLRAIADDLLVVSETNLDAICAHVVREKPALFIIDSIQTMYRPDIESAPGSVSQVRECAMELMRIAKTEGIAVFVIGHVTKEGSLAGPRVLEHIVDTVLYFEGERNAEYRVLRAVKNRFGSTNELGLFEMRDVGLVDVPDASKLFLSERAQESGSVIVPSVEGTRPLLVEVQALVAPTPYQPPRRTADSVDVKRIQLLLAVLEKRVKLPIGGADVYVKVAGGIRLDEPAADLALCVAMASSFANRLPRPHMVVCGEVGLSGEVRAVSQAELRVAEARRLGLRAAVLPMKNYRQLAGKFKDMDLFGAETIGDALKCAMPKNI
ncbi:DNA repair protein RadA [Selenomonas sp. oral taxon 137 str. F0430]|uniref:DNA repair protein RadA n=1 Tax=Selenomonas sp. oral taxon 137 TaxID=712531 RepID=UPI0001EB2184|nr:DNA repair protein RadA [Selenomonas sp. oral taxon 137]EFR41995.1 DNA repair protein RadA [Selenomonas sp. oral taxon 137 str. F0430]